MLVPSGQGIETLPLYLHAITMLEYSHKVGHTFPLLHCKHAI